MSDQSKISGSSVSRCAWRVAALRGGMVAAVVLSAVGVKRFGPGPAFVVVEEAAQDTVAAAAMPEPSVERPSIDLGSIELGSIELASFVEETAEAGSSPESFVDESGREVYTPAGGHVRYYNGRPIRPVRTVWMVTTAYSPDHRSCGKWADGKTASLKSVWTNGMESIAADTRLLPFGTLLSVPGYADGRVAPVLDRGGAIKGARLDLLYPTHEIARQWGVQRLPVTVWEYVEGEGT